MSDFERQDYDCIEMVRKNRECHPGGEPVILMAKKEAAALVMKAGEKNHERMEEEPQITRQQLILQLAHGLAPVCIGMAWVLGAFEGLADPAFTSVIAGVCLLWGCVEWKWVRFRG